jgi:hypothetical protein
MEPVYVLGWPEEQYFIWKEVSVFFSLPSP